MELIVGLLVASIAVWLAGIVWVAVALVLGAKRAPRPAVLLLGLGSGATALLVSVFVAAYAIPSTGPAILIVLAPSAVVGIVILRSVAGYWRQTPGGSDGHNP